MDGERAVALRPAQLTSLGLVVYAAIRRSWLAAATGLGLLCFDAARRSARPEFSPLDLVAPRRAPTSGS